MRFAIVVNNYPPKVGGVELHVANLVKALRARGHELTIFTLAAAPSLIVEADGVEICSLRERFRVGGVLGFPPIGTGRTLRREFRKRKIQVVSTHTRFFPMTYLGIRAAKAMGIPTIHTEHGSGYVASSSLLIRVASRLVDWSMGRYVLRKSSRVLGVSKDVLRFVKDLADVDAELFYNAIDTTKALPHPTRSNRLVFIGRIVEGKGWQIVLEIAERLAHDSRASNFQVVFLGEGNQLDELRQRQLELGDPDWLQVLGRVSVDEALKWLEGAVLVNPTTLSEGLQTTLLEAVISGAKIVSYPVPGTDLLLEQGASVAIVKRDALEAWIESVKKALKATPTAPSLNFLRFWSWQSRAAQYESLGQEVLAASTRI